jgi:ABC-type transport system substrate-binding protein
VNKLWHGRGAVPNDVYPRAVPLGYTHGKPPFEYAPYKAQQRLAAAGYKGEAIIITSPVGELANDRQVAEAVAVMLRDVGINAHVQLLGSARRIQQLRDKAIDGLWLDGQASALLDPDDLVWRLMQPGGRFDYWRHAQWDKLMGEARSLQPQAARQALYTQAAQIFLDEVPVLIVLQPEKIFALRKGMNWQARGDAVVVVDDITPPK